ncbi:methyltransferase domain-containing protein [Sulfitobacter faviae]|uniref:methyltransferase domain-containing protein n=1 Tax=Sulfitobacter faviae TaxID=1775881 RepID=UPI00398CB7D8
MPYFAPRFKPLVSERRSLDALDLPEAAFDQIYSALTFHYVKDFGRLMRAIPRTLTSGGDLVFTIEPRSSWPPPIRTGSSTRTGARDGQSTAIPWMVSAAPTGSRRGC